MTMTEAAVRERPILFSGPMVRAILDGRKTQTRRVVADRTSRGNFRASELLLHHPAVFADPGPSPAGNPGWYLHAPVNAGEIERRRGWKAGECDPSIVERLYPWVFAGDRLWVRERWTAGDPARSDGLGIIPRNTVREGMKVVYAATSNYGGDPPPWRSARFMPRWASRLTLEITEVRVQRVKEISDDDAVAEGVDDWGPLDAAPLTEKARDLPRVQFLMLWDSLNAKRGYSFESNPWVWALTFRSVLPSGTGG